MSAQQPAKAGTPNRAWWVERVWPGERKPKYIYHPLWMLAAGRRMTEGEAMDWLQERGWISDLCVSFDDVAPVDVERVLRAAGKLVLLPERWRVAFGLGRGD